MNKKIIAILFIGLLIATIFPCVGASINKNDEKENTIVYESRIYGFVFVRINGFAHVIRGFVLFGINDGQVITTKFINIKYADVD